MLNKQDQDFVALTLDNVARVEAMIRMDSNYTLSGNVKAEPSKHNNGTLYNGSTAYWMTLLKRIVDGESNIECKVLKNGKIVQRTLSWQTIAALSLLLVVHKSQSK